MKPQINSQHSFAIKVLGKLSGFFQPQRYLYYCVRCKWTFTVNDGRRGVVAAQDERGLRLNGTVGAARVSTFAVGPCPAMKILTIPVPRSRPPVLDHDGVHEIDNGASQGTNGSLTPGLYLSRRRAQRRVNVYPS